MDPGAAQKILAHLDEDDRVVDIGGWGRPFPRADYVIDAMPYESRGKLGKVYEGQEHFTEATWITRDLCSREPFPFADGYFDYAICSHVLEDVRDPIFVASEIARIAKRGYIETPSRLVEQTRGVESDAYCGYYHHRWYVEPEERGLAFTMKTAWPMQSWRLRFPKRILDMRPEADQVLSYFWNGTFEVRERLLITISEHEEYLATSVAESRVYSPMQYLVWDFARRLKRIMLGAQ